MSRLLCSAVCLIALGSEACQAAIITYQGDVTIINENSWLNGPPSFSTGFSSGESYQLTVSYDDSVTDSNSDFFFGQPSGTFIGALTQLLLTPTSANVDPGSGWNLLDPTTTYDGPPQAMFSAIPLAPTGLPGGVTITKVDLFNVFSSINDTGTGQNLTDQIGSLSSATTQDVIFHVTNGLQFSGVIGNVSNLQQITAVPEPTSMALVTLAAVGAGVNRFRRRRSANGANSMVATS